MANEIPKLNLLILGDAQVGKTALMFRFVEERFQTNFQANVGVAFLAKTLELDDGSQVKVQVWDTAGQERFASVTSSFFRAAHGVIVVFDVTNEKTLQSVQRWIQLARENKPEVPIAVMGNKCDLVDARKVTAAEAQQVCGDLKMTYYEASALNGEGVTLAFNQFVKRMHNEKKSAPPAKTGAAGGKSPGGAPPPNRAQNVNLRNTNASTSAAPKKSSCILL